MADSPEQDKLERVLYRFVDSNYKSTSSDDIYMEKLLTHLSGNDIYIVAVNNTWKDVLQFCYENQSIYVLRESQKFVVELLNRLGGVDSELPTNIMSEIFSPFLSKDTTNGKVSLESSQHQHFMLNLELACTIFEASLANASPVMSNVIQNLNLEPLMWLLLVSLVGDNNEEHAGKISKLLTLIYFTSTLREMEENKIPYSAVKAMEKKIYNMLALHVSRRSVPNFMKLVVQCQFCWHKISEFVSVTEESGIKHFNFDTQLMVFQSTLNDLNNKLETLTSSPFLHADQKYCVLNTSICPSLIYQFQTIPSELMPKKFLDDADKLIKSAEVLNLPTDILDAMIYSPRKYKGLGIFRTKWKVLLQQINALRCLQKSQNPYIIQTRQVHEESIRCAQSLNIVPEDGLFHKNEHFLNATKIRNLLRNREFDIWCCHSQKGKGVVLFKQYPSANKWICKHEGLSNSEWRDGIKMVGNVAAVHAVPGRSQDNRCRHCHNEVETLAHVLGSCPHCEGLQNARHHQVRSIIATALKDADYNTFEEEHGLSDTGSTRHIDIIAFKESTRSGFIIDPTVRFKTNEEQPAEVDKEKKNIYNPTIPYYLQKCQLEELEVIGLLVGARGTAILFMKDAFKRLGIPTSIIPSVTLAALKESIALLKHHLYSK
ncbi:hypothetical protein ANN_10959 [Periplaneta americana]|uniref:Uncharacterized protein n=1 Tax=Periplaneta americana TaxID=6978 RepID=A0ABQ8T4Y9_PERAM|nr:hypothetical protein ANN_10959 [Periplaneta americana]